MATQDANPQHDSREGLPVYEGADAPEDGSPAAQDAHPGEGIDQDPRHDTREGDPVYQDAPPSGSGGADSFDARHGEFDESEGQRGAGVDARTGEAVHGDGLAQEQAEEPRSGGFDAEQPNEVQEAGDVDEPNAEQPREQR